MSEFYATTVTLPDVGTVAVTVKVIRGHQGGAVVRQIITEALYADGTDLSREHRRTAFEMLPVIE